MKTGIKQRIAALAIVVGTMSAIGLAGASSASAMPVPHVKSVGCHVVTLSQLAWWDARCMVGFTVSVADPRCFGPVRYISC